MLLPCYNESAGIADVVAGFRKALPEAEIYVFDNNSTDATAERAAAAGARVFSEPCRGKGNVVRRMFADVEADIYVMADGDGTYDPAFSPRLIELLRKKNLDMVVGIRIAEAGAHRFGHRWGNVAYNWAVRSIFGSGFSDIFSGYRIFSRRFVKTFPALARGFDIETELTVHALDLRTPCAEVPVPYRARVQGSSSKLRTVRDGLKIFFAMMLLFKEVRPLRFFALISSVLFAAALVLGYPLLTTWLETGLVPRFPTAILATGISLLGFLSLTCGLILDSVARSRRESKRLVYLAQPGPLSP